jgi:hypothetical protein
VTLVCYLPLRTQLSVHDFDGDNSICDVDVDDYDGNNNNAIVFNYLGADSTYFTDL